MAQPDMRGKVCLVTGSSSGLGKATARGLAKLGRQSFSVAVTSSVVS